MAHIEQLAFVEIISSEILKSKKCNSILEIGSYDVNGSIRPFFKNSEYIGVDLIEGKGVDVVGDGHTLDYSDDTFDMVISCESFEHNPYWKETFLNMIRMTRKGGLIVFTCATTGRAEHGTTRTSSIDSPGTIQMNWDYYRNLEDMDFYNETLGFDNFFNKFLFLNNEKRASFLLMYIKMFEDFSNYFYKIDMKIHKTMKKTMNKMVVKFLFNCLSSGSFKLLLKEFIKYKIFLVIFSINFYEILLNALITEDKSKKNNLR